MFDVQLQRFSVKAGSSVRSEILRLVVGERQVRLYLENGNCLKYPYDGRPCIKNLGSCERFSAFFPDKSYVTLSLVPFSY
jgi:hypothetical protein